MRRFRQVKVPQTVNAPTGLAVCRFISREAATYNSLGRQPQDRMTKLPPSREAATLEPEQVSPRRG